MKQVEELKASMQEELEQAKTDYNAAQERTNYLFNNVVSKPYRNSISGYQVRYSRSPGFKTYNTYRTTRKTGTYAKISRLRKNTRYYVKVRTFRKVKGKYYYSTWSKIKSVKTR